MRCRDTRIRILLLLERGHQHFISREAIAVPGRIQTTSYRQHETTEPLDCLYPSYELSQKDDDSKQVGLVGIVGLMIVDVAHGYC